MKAQTGWSFETDHPVRALLTFDGASTPPVPGGAYGSPTFKFSSRRGQALVEVALQIPLMMALLFGGVEIGRVFYTYHALNKALRGGAGLAARAVNVNYCDTSDVTLTDVRNFVVFGNLQGEGNPIVSGLTADMIQILPERSIPYSTGISECVCTEATDSCDVTATGRAPDFVVLNFGPDGFPLRIPFPFSTISSVNLRVSVRMPVTGS